MLPIGVGLADATDMKTLMHGADISTHCRDPYRGHVGPHTLLSPTQNRPTPVISTMHIADCLLDASHGDSYLVRPAHLQVQSGACLQVHAGELDPYPLTPHPTLPYPTLPQPNSNIPNRSVQHFACPVSPLQLLPTPAAYSSPSTATTTFFLDNDLIPC